MSTGAQLKNYKEHGGGGEPAQLWLDPEGHGLQKLQYFVKYGLTCLAASGK